MKRFNPKWLLVILGVGMLAPTAAFGRPMIVNGNAEVWSTHNSNIFKRKIDVISETKTFASPSLTLSSPGSDNTFTMSYSPTYSLNHRRDEYTLDQEANVFFEKNLSPKLKFNFKNDFNSNDNPAPEAVTATTLATQFVQLSSAKQQDVIRVLFDDVNWGPDGFDASSPAHLSFVQSEIQNRYNNASAAEKTQVDNIIVVQTINREFFWTNITSFNAEYEYMKDSKFSFGYEFTKKENDTTSQSESDSHNPHFEIDHKFSQQLGVLAAYDYTSKDYTLSDDSKTHDSSVKMSYQFDFANLLSAEYENVNIKYDGTQSDQDKHTVSLDYDHTFSDVMSLNLSSSPYTIDNDTTNDERGYGLAATLTKKIQQGQLSLEGEWTSAEQQTVSGWNDLREEWSLETGIDYEFTKILTSSASLSYGERQSWAGTTKSDYYDYGADLDVSYQFNQWLEMSMEYEFSRVDSDNTTADDYYNNEVMFKVSASNELWRW